MGIKNLKPLITKYAKEAVNERFLCTYEYKVLAIDISIYLYRYIYLNGEPLELLTKQTMRLLKNKVIPLYIFDGKPPKEKNDVLDERSIQKKELIDRRTQIKEILSKKEIIDDNVIDNINDDIDLIGVEDLYKMSIEELQVELEKVDKRIIIVNGKVISDCKKLFELMGVPYIVAKGEAESLCARLVKENLVYGCMSEDTDILSNGGRYFIRNFNVNNNKVIEYDLNVILDKFGMTYEQFIDVCILCGCDYTGTIKNIGMDKAYKFIKKCGNIENLIEYIKEENEKWAVNKNNKNNTQKFIIPDNFNYIKARELFITCGNDENYDELKDIIKLHKPNLDKLIDYLSDTAKPPVISDLKRNLNKFVSALMNDGTTIDQFYKIV